MNEQYLEMAKKQVSDIRMLVPGVAKRVSQLAHGGKPLISMPTGAQMEFIDIALLEVAEGKITLKAPINES